MIFQEKQNKNNNNKQTGMYWHWNMVHIETTNAWQWLIGPSNDSKPKS